MKLATTIVLVLSIYGDVVKTATQNCGNLMCPENTVTCTESVETSYDRRSLIKKSICLDGHGNILLQDVSGEPNPSGGQINMSSSKSLYGTSSSSYGQSMPMKNFNVYEFLNHFFN